MARKTKAQRRRARSAALVDVTLPLQAAIGAMALAKPGPKKRRNRRARTTGRQDFDGRITITKSEIVDAIKLKAGESESVGHFNILPASFPFLSKMGAVFERIKWLSVQFWYKPAVGMTEGGIVTVGVDWDWSATDPARVKIAGYTPSQSFSVWTDTQAKPLVLPPGRIQGRAWYTPATGDAVDKGPGKLCYGVTGSKPTSDKVYGELWVRYTVTMEGTAV